MRNLLLKLGLSVFGMIVAMIVSSPSAFAYSNGRLMDDRIFDNVGSMNEQQIRDFINARPNSCLAKVGANLGGGNIYPEPKDYFTYGPNNVDAARVIYNAAIYNDLNPQVILATLQKEQSLLSDTDCLDQGGNPRLPKAMGQGCFEGQACPVPAYAGFHQQVMKGAWQLKFSKERANGNVNWGQNGGIPYSGPWTQGDRQVCGTVSSRCNPVPPAIYRDGFWTIDGQVIKLETGATASFYSYTPHLGQALPGIFEGWFGSTTVPSLVRTPSSQTYNLINNGKRFAIASGDILYAYGLQSIPLNVVSDSLLASIPDGGMLNTIFTTPGDPTVYLADGGKKYGIASGAYCTRWALECGNAAVLKEIDAGLANALPNGGTLTSIGSFQGGIYLMENGTKRPFMTVKSISDNGYGSVPVTPIVNWTNAIRPYGLSLLEEGSFVQFASSGAIYAYAHNTFYGIPDFETFRSWSSPSTPVIVDRVSLYNSQLPAASTSLSRVIVAADTKKYLVDGGKRVDLAAQSGSWPAGLAATDLNTLVARLPVTTTATAGGAYREPDGGIFRVAAQSKQPFRSLRDYYDLGYGNQALLQISGTTLPLSLGNTALAEGATYKVQGSDAIFFVGQGGKSYYMTNTGQIADYAANPKVITISPADASQFAVQGALPSLAVGGGQYYVITRGGKVALAAGAISAWGITTTNALPLTATSLGRIGNSNLSPIFFTSPAGTIFKGESGSKRPIASFQTYKNLGGNSTNTVAAPQDLLDLSPTGTIYP